MSTVFFYLITLRPPYLLRMQTMQYSVPHYAGSVRCFFRPHFQGQHVLSFRGREKAGLVARALQNIFSNKAVEDCHRFDITPQHLKGVSGIGIVDNVDRVPP